MPDIEVIVTGMFSILDIIVVPASAPVDIVWPGDIIPTETNLTVIVVSDIDALNVVPVADVSIIVFSVIEGTSGADPTWCTYALITSYARLFHEVTVIRDPSDTTELLIG
jgi:hypothetical protein